MRARVLDNMRKRQQLFPSELLVAQAWERVDESNLDELASRLASVFPPVVLPLFVREGDVIGEHVSPGVVSSKRGWFLLPHDETEPRLIAGELSCLPRRLLRPPFAVARRLHDAWRGAVTMAAEHGLARLPPEEEYQLLKTQYSAEFDARLDPSDGSSCVTALFEDVSWDDEPRAKQVLENLFVERSDDLHVVAATAVARAAGDDPSARPLARRVLDAEVTHGFIGATQHFVRSLTSSAAVLEGMRKIVASAIGNDDELLPIRASVLTERAGAVHLRDVAKAFRAASNFSKALMYQRNAMWAAGRFASIDRAACEELASFTRAVEPDGLSADLADLAASVIDRGP